MKQRRLNKALMGGVSYALLVTILLQSASAQTPNKPASPSQPATPRTHRYTATWSASSYLQSEEDSSVNPMQTTITYKNDSVYHIRMAGDKVIALSVDNREIPADSFYVYSTLTKKLALQIKADKAQAKLDKAQAEKDEIQAVEDRRQAEKDETQAKEDRLQAERDRLQEKQDAEEANQGKLQAEREQVEARIEKVQAEREKETVVVQARITAKAQEQATRDRSQAMEDRRQAMQDRQQAERDRAQAERDREQAVKDRKQAAEDRAMIKKLISEIVAEGLIPDEKSLRSLSLDEDGFIINGKQQPDALLKKFQEKYLLKPGYRISYHYDQGGRGL